MPNKIGNEVKCKYCGYTWKVRSKARWISCPNCLQKTKNEKFNKDNSLIDIGDEMKKLKVDPEYIYQDAVSEKGIKAKEKYIGKIATVIIDKKNVNGMTDKEGRELADAWEKGSI